MNLPDLFLVAPLIGFFYLHYRTKGSVKNLFLWMPLPVVLLLLQYFHYSVEISMTLEGDNREMVCFVDGIQKELKEGKQVEVEKFLNDINETRSIILKSNDLSYVHAIMFAMNRR